MEDRGIFIKNLYYMLAYVYDDLYRLDSKSVATEKFEDALNLLASMLCKLVSRILKRGLAKEYLKVNQDIDSVKGKVNINKTIILKSRQVNRISCEYEALSIDNYLNRILKTTIYHLLISKEVSKENKQDLKKLIFYFQDVELIDISKIKNISYNRNNLHYRDAINLCDLILNDLIISTDNGECILSEFLSDKKMHSIYEKFVLKYYKRHYPMLKPSSSRIKWNLDDDNNKLLPIMITDITLTYNQKVFIIDTKYYARIINSNFESQKLHSNNLYQIFTYVKNKDKDNTGNVSGVILYAKTGEDIEVDNEYKMSGNKIFVKTLDLNKEFEFIRAQLDSIAKLLMD